MSTTKSPVKATINLQNGKFCHLIDNTLVVSRQHRPKSIPLPVDLSKTKNVKKFRIFLNILFTLMIIATAIWSDFYPLVLLMFLSLWDLRQLKRYTLPINKTKVIPLDNIEGIELKKGQMGFNYMDVYIQNDGIKSLVPLQLYDSASTLLYAKTVAQEIGKLTKSPEIEKVTLKGYQIPLNETSSYISSGKSFLYCHNDVHTKSRVDSYKYVRVISYFVIALLLICIGIKVNSILTLFTNFIDYIVVLIFALLTLIPIKYTQKALPNNILYNDILEVKKGKKKTYMVIKQKRGLNLKVHFKNKFVPSDIQEHLKININ